MYLIEFERTGVGRTEQIAVRIFDAHAEAKEGELLGEYFYDGHPPELRLTDGVNFTALRIPRKTD